MVIITKLYKSYLSIREGGRVFLAAVFVFYLRYQAQQSQSWQEFPPSDLLSKHDTTNSTSLEGCMRDRSIYFFIEQHFKSSSFHPKSNVPNMI